MSVVGSVGPADTWDTELLVLAEEFERLQLQIDPLRERFFSMSSEDPELGLVGTTETALVEQQDELAERAKEIPVATMAGVRAKATMAACLFGRHYSNVDEAACYGEELGFAWGFIEDILRLRNEPQHIEGAPTATLIDPVPALWAQTQAVNAKLRRVSDQQAALRKEIDRRRPDPPKWSSWVEWHRDDPDLARCTALINRSNELCGTSTDLYHQIAEAAATSAEGIRAKAAAALSIWVQEKALQEEMWCYDLIHNALREAAAGSAA